MKKSWAILIAVLGIIVVTLLVLYGPKKEPSPTEVSPEEFQETIEAQAAQMKVVATPVVQTLIEGNSYRDADVMLGGAIRSEGADIVTEVQSINPDQELCMFPPKSDGTFCTLSALTNTVTFSEPLTAQEIFAITDPSLKYILSFEEKMEFTIGSGVTPKGEVRIVMRSNADARWPMWHRELIWNMIRQEVQIKSTEPITYTVGDRIAWDAALARDQEAGLGLFDQALYDKMTANLPPVDYQYLLQIGLGDIKNLP